MDSVRANRAVQILRFSLPTTGACRHSRSHCRRTAGSAISRRMPITTAKTASASPNQWWATVSLMWNSSSVSGGRVSIWSNKSLNCGMTKVISTMTTPTVSTAKISGYIILLPTCWFILCSRS